MRAHLIVFKSAAMSYTDLVAMLDEWDDIPYWFRCLPNSVFVATDLTAKRLAERIHSSIDTEAATYVVAELQSGKVEGWLPEEAWWLINNPDDPKMPRSRRRKRE